MISANNKRKLLTIFLCGVVLLLFIIFYNFEKVKEILAHPQLLVDFFKERFNEVFTNGFDWTYILIYFGVAVGSFIVEMLFVGWEKSALKRLIAFKDKSTQNDVICWLLNLFNLFNLLAFIITLGVTFFFYGWVAQRLDLDLISQISSPVIQFGVIALVGTFVSYWKHRFYHSFASWWELHKYHHSATAFNMITHHRAHPLETAANIAFSVFPFAILGAPIESYLAFYLFQETHQFFVHSNLDWTWGWFGKYVLVSPAAHRLHHSAKPEHFNKNFSTFLPIWDHVFMSWHDPEEVKELGFEDNPYNKTNFIKDMVIGYKRFFARLLGLK